MSRHETALASGRNELPLKNPSLRRGFSSGESSAKASSYNERN